MRQVYNVTPLQFGISEEFPSLHNRYVDPVWPSRNWEIKQRSIQKPWGYLEDRDLGDGVQIQKIMSLNLSSGASYTCYLTESDLAVRTTSTNETFAYKTETGDYGATIASISGATVTGKAGTTFSTDGVVAGDMFILDVDHSANIEPDANWATISSVDSETQLTLSASYTGTTGTWGGAEKDCLIRKVYTVPSGERWTATVVKDVLYFTNGNTAVQAWNGSGYASAVDSTNASKARYCTSFASRLILADTYISSSRQPLVVQWCANGDPTDWTSTDAGYVELVDSTDFITGVCKYGADLLVFKTDGFVIGHQTGDDTAPIAFDREKRGLGLVAPYSLVQVSGTWAFLWRDDFYIMDSDTPTPIGEKIRNRFFDIVGDTEIENTFGFTNVLKNQAMWRASTSNGIFWFIWDYKYNEWYVREFADDMYCGGVGVI